MEVTKTLINIVRRKEKEIYEAKIAYYTTGTPIMSDYLYDKLEDSLAKICPNHPILEMVGYDINGKYKKLSYKKTEELLNENQRKETE